MAVADDCGRRYLIAAPVNEAPQNNSSAVLRCASIPFPGACLNRADLLRQAAEPSLRSDGATRLDRVNCLRAYFFEGEVEAVIRPLIAREEF